MKTWLIRGAKVVDPSQNLEDTRDILIKDRKIQEIGTNIISENAEIIEANGLIAAPGLVDMHVHLRDPGQTHKETVQTGCQSAAAAGVTSLACMPNTSPACDSAAVVEEILRKAAAAKARVYPVAAISTSLEGRKLTDFAALQKAGAVALSDDGRPVPTAGMMAVAMERAARLGMPVLSHCEEITLVRGGIMHEGVVSEELGVPGIHRGAEEVATAREIALAAATGCPVHICHVSTAGSVALLRDARRRGVSVTGETAPHYFALTDECLRARDADYRMNPPLRTEADRQAVIEGLRDGTLQAIATDHAPHTPEEKADFLKAPNGAIGMETSLAAGLTYLVKPGHLSLMRLIETMSTWPAKLLHIPAGTLRPGAAADLVLFDPDKEWTVDVQKLHGKSRNCCFKGMTLTGQVLYTFLGGELVFSRG